MTIDEALKVLEMEAPATEAALGKAYGEAFTIWNPESFKANPTLHAKAEGKMESINEAYWVIAAWLGMDGAINTETAASQEPRNEVRSDDVIFPEMLGTAQPPPIPVQPPPLPVPQTPVSVRPPPIPQPQSSVSAPPLFPKPALAFPPESSPAPKSDDAPVDLINDKFIIVCCSILLVGIIEWVILDKTVLSAQAAAGQEAKQEPSKKAQPTPQDIEKYNADLMAAKRGDAEAQARVGNCLMEGIVCPVDLPAAREWLVTAADQGQPEAFYGLGEYYSQVTIFKHDAEARLFALFFYQLSAEKGYRPTEVMIGIYTKMLTPQQLGEVNEWKERYHQLEPEGYAVSLFLQERSNKKLAKTLEGLSGQSSLPKRTRLDSPPTLDNGAIPSDRLEHLPTDERLKSGFMSIIGLSVGGGQLTVKNGFSEDAYVKMIENGKLKIVLYVRGGEEALFTGIPDGDYTVIYSLGYGWNKERRDFNRGRIARKFDQSLLYTTVANGNDETVTTYRMTLHKTIHGKASTQLIAEDEFDKY